MKILPEDSKWGFSLQNDGISRGFTGKSWVFFEQTRVSLRKCDGFWFCNEKRRRRYTNRRRRNGAMAIYG